MTTVQYNDLFQHLFEAEDASQYTTNYAYNTFTAALIYGQAAAPKLQITADFYGAEQS